LGKIILGDECIPYTLKHSKRRSIGLKIDSDGLAVSTPIGESLRTVETLLRKKENWILKNLEKCKQRKSTELVWSIDTHYPLLGKPWKIMIQTSGAIKMVPLDAQMQMNINSSEVSLMPQQIEHFVMVWYFEQAHHCFSERITHYRSKLNVATPILKLSRAKTRWGSCNSRGVVHLNWRLIQLPLELIDYVVAHELSHLIEMSHSLVFWKLVASIYPDYNTARKRLKEYG